MAYNALGIVNKLSRLTLLIKCNVGVMLATSHLAAQKNLVWVSFNKKNMIQFLFHKIIFTDTTLILGYKGHGESG